MAGLLRIAGDSMFHTLGAATLKPRAPAPNEVTTKWDKNSMIGESAEDIPLEKRDDNQVQKKRRTLQLPVSVILNAA